MESHQEDLIAQFSAVTGANPSIAQSALDSANWNLQEAVALYFAAHEETQEPGDDDELEEEMAQAAPTSTASQPTPAQPAASSSSRQPQNKRPKQMTLDDLKKMQEEDDSSDEGDKKQDMFAGGEKSGLAVQNPGQGNSGGGVDHFKNIMNQARQNRDRPTAAGEQEEQPQRSSNFAGRAQTLGGDDAESQIVEDPTTPGRSQPATRVTRTLHLWADGVSIDEGPLFRFDDPANQGIMAEINRGRAPLALLDVQPDQEVDLNLEPHKDQNYVQPKQKYKPFSGSGQRLGSPTPGPGGPSSSTATTSAPSTSTQTASTNVEVDESQPTIQLRVQLGDGSRLPARFNATHTIGDVYAFVDRARPESTQRPYALMTTFPPKELDDRSLALGDSNELKKGGVVVQKWK